MGPEVQVQGPGFYTKSYGEQLKQKNDRIKHVFSNTCDSGLFLKWQKRKQRHGPWR